VLASTISAPVALRSPGDSARTVPCVPTGMKTGVSTVPWGRVRVPVRAGPEVAPIVNSNIKPVETAVSSRA